MLRYFIIGDIDVIAAIGDSLTAASGATSTRFQDLFMENRGLSWVTVFHFTAPHLFKLFEFEHIVNSLITMFFFFCRTYHLPPHNMLFFKSTEYWGAMELEECYHITQYIKGIQS